MNEKKLTKQERHDQRIRKARQWLTTYEGSPKKITKHYRERTDSEASAGMQVLFECAMHDVSKFCDGQVKM